MRLAMNTSARPGVVEPDALLRSGALADALNASRTYVWAMKRQGFVMPGGRATVLEARQWLREHPEFRVNRILLTAVNVCEQQRS